MFLRLLLLLTVVPLVELVILFRIADHFSWERTIALIVLTGVVGAYLARREGLKTLAKIQADLAAGVTPASAVMDGALILAAGALLVTPGVLTDLCGFALLVPPIRRRIKHHITEALKKRVVVIHPPGQDPFIDVPGEGRDVDDPSGNEGGD